MKAKKEKRVADYSYKLRIQSNRLGLIGNNAIVSIANWLYQK